MIIGSAAHTKFDGLVNKAIKLDAYEDTMHCYIGNYDMTTWHKHHNGVRGNSFSQVMHFFP